MTGRIAAIDHEEAVATRLAPFAVEHVGRDIRRNPAHCGPPKGGPHVRLSVVVRAKTIVGATFRWPGAKTIVGATFRWPIVMRPASRPHHPTQAIDQAHAGSSGGSAS